MAGLYWNSIKIVNARAYVVRLVVQSVTPKDGDDKFPGNDHDHAVQTITQYLC